MYLDEGSTRLGCIIQVFIWIYSTATSSWSSQSCHQDYIWNCYQGNIFPGLLEPRDSKFFLSKDPSNPTPVSVLVIFPAYKDIRIRYPLNKEKNFLISAWKVQPFQKNFETDRLRFTFIILQEKEDENKEVTAGNQDNKQAQCF